MYDTSIKQVTTLPSNDKKRVNRFFIIFTNETKITPKKVKGNTEYIVNKVYFLCPSLCDFMTGYVSAKGMWIENSNDDEIVELSRRLVLADPDKSAMIDVSLPLTNIRFVQAVSYMKP